MSRSSRRAVLSGLMLWAALGVGCGGERNLGPVGVRGPDVTVKEANPGQVIPLVAEVMDPEGDPLTYRWTQSPVEPAGTFSDPTIPEPTWTAPQVTAPITFRLTLRVEELNGAVLEGYDNVTVRPRGSN